MPASQPQPESRSSAPSGAEPLDAEDAVPLGVEDAKLLTLARATRARTSASQGAACRDLDGRTYAAAAVDLPSLRLSAVQVCVAMAVAGGSAGLEAVVVFGGEIGDDDRAALADFAGSDVVVHLR